MNERRRGDAEVLEHLGYIRGKVDGIEGHVGSISGQIKGHDDRLDSLETSRDKATAVGTFVSGCAVLAGGIAAFWNSLFGGE